MAPSKYVEGERVLCFHGPLIYEAKCLKLKVNEEDSNLNKYLVHYTGWNKNWDEWVPESRILKYNEANVARQKELHGTHKSAFQKKTKTTTPKGQRFSSRESKNSDTRSEGSVHDSDSRSSTPNFDIRARYRKELKRESYRRDSPTSSQEIYLDLPRRKKRTKQEPQVESEPQPAQKLEIKVKIPETLKPWLVDDWDYITRQKKLVILPAGKSVEEILDDYIAYKVATRGSPHYLEASCRQVVLGLKDYFNIMIGSQLLFKFERPQYAELLRAYPNTPMSQIYGSHHLLRLFVKIGTVLSHTELDERSIRMLLAMIQDVLIYICNRAVVLFSVQNYGIAPPEYHRKVM